MKLGNKNKKPLLDPSIPVFIFVAGLSFCVIIWLLNIYHISSSDVDYLNYFFCKRYAGFNYFEWCSFILLGFCFLSLLLIPARKKIYSIALIISCLSILLNTTLLKKGARIAHAGFILRLEKAILSPDTDPYNQPWSKKRYLFALENWRVTEGVELQPLPSAYWSASEKAEFNTTNYVGWSATEPIINNDVPEKLFFSDQGKAAGLLPDGTMLFGFSSSEAFKTNDQKYICFNLETDTLDYEFFASRANGILDTRYDIWSDPSWPEGRMKYSLIHSATNQRIESQ
ncbi:hypothetical protein P4C99_11550 [Pontiellaceae bacterium B1224]|nr:hypothetical protein [Pontiellaceae bacterium B1224]